MTFEEIQQMLELLLAVQREIQESQLRNREDINLLIEQSRQSREDINLLIEQSRQSREDINLLIEQSRQQNKNIERLIGYSITVESDHLDLEERFATLERRVKKLEDNPTE